MILLYVLLAIFAIFLLLLILPITFRIDTEKNAYQLFFAGIRLDFKKKQKKVPKQPKKVTKKHNFAKEYFQKTGFQNSVSEITDLIKCLIISLKKFAKSINIKVFRFDLEIGSENAADTAVYYGVVCSTIYPVYNLLINTFNIDNKHFDVSSNFSANKSELRLKVDFTSSAVLIIIAFIPLLPKIIKMLRRINENE